MLRRLLGLGNKEAGNGPAAGPAAKADTLMDLPIPGTAPEEPDLNLKAPEPTFAQKFMRLVRRDKGTRSSNKKDRTREVVPVVPPVGPLVDLRTDTTASPNNSTTRPEGRSVLGAVGGSGASSTPALALPAARSGGQLDALHSGASTATPVAAAPATTTATAGAGDDFGPFQSFPAVPVSAPGALDQSTSTAAGATVGGGAGDDFGDFQGDSVPGSAAGAGDPGTREDTSASPLPPPDEVVVEPQVPTSSKPASPPPAPKGPGPLRELILKMPGVPESVEDEVSERATPVPVEQRASPKAKSPAPPQPEDVAESESLGFGAYLSNLMASVRKQVGVKGEGEENPFIRAFASFLAVVVVALAVTIAFPVTILTFARAKAQHAQKAAEESRVIPTVVPQGAASENPEAVLRTVFNRPPVKPLSRSASATLPSKEGPTTKDQGRHSSLSQQ